MPFAPLLLRWIRVVVLSLIVARIASPAALAAETIPPVPRAHFNDYAGVVSPAAARQLDERLAAFERVNSGQVVVAVFPRMESSAPVRDYTLRVAQAWGVGRKDRDNGVVLFAFMQERQLYIQVGAGLEQSIPDSAAQQIIDRRIVPRFRARDIDGGLRDGVDAILAAIRAEAPRPVSSVETPVEAARPPPPRPAPPATAPAPAIPPVSLPVSRGGGGGGGLVFIVIVIALIVGAARALGGGETEYDSFKPRRGPSLFGRGPGGFGGFGGGSSSRRSSGGGSFSRGGGSFRGGGAGGKW